MWRVHLLLLAVNTDTGRYRVLVRAQLQPSPSAGGDSERPYAYLPGMATADESVSSSRIYCRSYHRSVEPLEASNTRFSFANLEFRSALSGFYGPSVAERATCVLDYCAVLLLWLLVTVFPRSEECVLV